MENYQKIPIGSEVDDVSNAVQIGAFGVPGLNGFADSYLRAAKLLSEATEISGSGSEFIPIFFLYRHSIELRLKALLLLSWQIRKTSTGEERLKITEKVEQGHEFDDILNKIKVELTETKNEDVITSALKSRLEDLQELDGSSIAFRYPLLSLSKTYTKNMKQKKLPSTEIRKTLTLIATVQSLWDSTFSDTPYIDAKTFCSTCEAIHDMIKEASEKLVVDTTI
jgi:hypothetical protein